MSLQMPFEQKFVNAEVVAIIGTFEANTVRFQKETTTINWLMCVFETF